MIKGLFFTFAIFTVVWLALWTVRAESGQSARWAPFDMREPDQAQAEGPARASSPRGRQVRSVRMRRAR